MSQDSPLYVTSVQGETLRLQTHALAFLATPGQEAERVEPALIGPGEKPRLKVATSADSFSWQYADGLGQENGALKFLLLGRCGDHAVSSREADRAGESPWKDWLGCDQVDLVPVDAEGLVCGDSQSLAHPAPLGAQVKFSPSTSRQEVMVRPDSRRPASLWLTLWKRVQNGHWIQANPGWELSSPGLTCHIPMHQGAFVVTSRSGELVTVQFFAFGALHSGDEADFQEIDRQHAQRKQTVAPLWPLWCQEQLFRGLGLEQIEAANTHDLVRALREESRRRLLRGSLDASVADWRPESSIEEFAGGRWPHFAKLLARKLSEPAMREAWKFRDSPLLPETIAWTGERMEHLELCLRWAEDKRTCDRLGQTISPGCSSWPVYERFAAALAELSAHGPTSEGAARQRWGELSQSIQEEFGCAPESLDRARVDETTLALALQKTSRLLHGGPSAGRDVTLGLDSMIVALTKAKEGDLPELFERCVAAKVFDAELAESYPPEFQGLMAELRQRLQTPPRKDVAARCETLLQLLNDPAATRAIVCQIQAALICSTIERREIELHPGGDFRMQDLRRKNAGLREWLSYALDRAAERAELRRVAELRKRQEVQVKRLLPSALEPDSEAAEEWLLLSLTAVREQANEMVIVFGSDLRLTAGERSRMMEEGRPSEVATISAETQRLARMCAIEPAISRWQAYMREVHERLLGLLLPPGDKQKPTVSRLLTTGEFRLAKRLATLLGNRPNLNQIPELAWMDPDASFADELIWVYYALEELDGLARPEEIGAVLSRFEAAMTQIGERGGVAALQERWTDERNRRLSAVRDELEATGLEDLDEDALQRLWEQGSSAGHLRQGLERELVEKKFSEHGLVRPARRPIPS